MNMVHKSMLHGSLYIIVSVTSSHIMVLHFESDLIFHFSIAELIIFFQNSSNSSTVLMPNFSNSDKCLVMACPFTIFQRSFNALSHAFFFPPGKSIHHQIIVASQRIHISFSIIGDGLRSQ
jgi:hypothetical protein